MQGRKKGVKMRLQNMFKKTGERENPVRKGRLRRRPEAPEGLLKKCNKCGAAILSEEVINGAYICPKCHGYFRVPAYKRIEMIADEGSFEEWDMDLDGMDGPPDPLQFKGYSEKIKKLREQTGLKEAVVTGRVKINGKQAVIGVCDGRFMMASMGYAVGEKITRAVEYAQKHKLPLVIFSASGASSLRTYRSSSLDGRLSGFGYRARQTMPLSTSTFRFASRKRRYSRTKRSLFIAWIALVRIAIFFHCGCRSSGKFGKR